MNAEDVKLFVAHLERAKAGAEEHEKEYAGKREISNKLMRVYYGAKAAAFAEASHCLRTIMGVFASILRVKNDIVPHGAGRW